MATARPTSRDVLPPFSTLPSLVGILSAGIATATSISYMINNQSTIATTATDKTLIGLNVSGNALDIGCKAMQIMQIKAANNSNNSKRR